MLGLSTLARQIQPSATLAAGAKARQLKAQGIKVFDFSLGQPDFPTPEHICQAAVKAMKQGHTGYTPANGIPELRAAIAKFYQTAYGISYTPEQIVVSNGAKHSIYNVLATLVGPGDEVIIPSPYWVSYSDMVEMTGAKYVLVQTSAENQFKMTPAQLREAISPRSRLVMINSPSNPTGTVYTRRELESLADEVLNSKLSVLSDEIYERLIYGDARPTCFATLRPELKDRTLTVSGASKTYSMTGWRMGWACGPAPAIKAMGDIQSQQTGCPCSVSQYAALAALEGEQGCVEKMRHEFEERRDLVCRRLNAIDGIHCKVPLGAFYAFFNIDAISGRSVGGITIRNSADFCQAALDQAHVNLVPGSAFGAEGFVRLSYAASLDQLNGGLDQLQKWLMNSSH